MMIVLGSGESGGVYIFYTREDELWERVCEVRTQAAGLAAAKRSMRTLFLRVRKACESALALALALAQYFDGHANVHAIVNSAVANS